MATYKIEFDTMAGHPHGTGATLTPPVLNLVGWRSIGNAQGGRFVNNTGKVIRAIYLKIASAGNAFDISAASGGNLFNTIWTYTDPSGAITEAYFLDGNVPNVIGSFWMRVPANTQTEINDCDNQQACPFMGQAFDVNPQVPAGQGWNKIKPATPVPAPPHPFWNALVEATPSDYRGVGALHESPDGKKVLFSAAGEILLFDKASQKVAIYVAPKVGTAPHFDEIDSDPESGDFRLIHKGVPIKTIDSASSTFREL